MKMINIKMPVSKINKNRIIAEKRSYLLRQTWDWIFLKYKSILTHLKAISQSKKVLSCKQNLSFDLFSVQVCFYNFRRVEYIKKRTTPKYFCIA